VFGVFASVRVHCLVCGGLRFTLGRCAYCAYCAGCAYCAAAAAVVFAAAAAAACGLAGGYGGLSMDRSGAYAREGVARVVKR